MTEIRVSSLRKVSEDDCVFEALGRIRLHGIAAQVEESSAAQASNQLTLQQLLKPDPETATTL